MRTHRIAPLAKVEVDDLTVRVRWGPLFRADIPRTAVASVRTVTPPRWAGIGVHMVRGGWIVNARFGDAAELRFHEPVPARTLGIGIRPKRLLLGVEDPDALVADLGG